MVGPDHPEHGEFELGLARSLEFKVTMTDTAVQQGSGALEVLATPRLIAWMEAATCAVADSILDPSRTSVGVRVVVDHEAPSPIGARIVATAVITSTDRHLITFSVVGVDATTSRVVGRGTVTRAVVDRGRFMTRIEG